jgi:hypothetical protein
MTSADAATAAARAAQQLYFENTTPGPSKAPPLFEVSHKTLQSFPSESTLSPANIQHPQATTQLPVNIFGNDEELGQNQVPPPPPLLAAPEMFREATDAYENAIANELDDILMYNVNHGEKMSGVFISCPDDADDVLEDLDEDG